MSKPDLSGIDPLRRAEVRRRIDILKRYVSIATPTAAETAESAADIGLSLSQFYRLVKAWRIHRDPTTVGVGKPRNARPRRDGVSEAVKRIAYGTIRDLGAATGHTDVYREVVRRCEGSGVTPPSTGAIWTYVMDARATSRISSVGPSSIVVGRIHAKLPTAYRGTTVLPEIAIALLLPERLIIGIDVSLGVMGGASVALALARGFALSLPSDPELSLVADPTDMADVTPVFIAGLGREPRLAKGSPERLISANLGRVFGGMGLIYRAQLAKVRRLLKSQSARPIDPSTASDVIARAVAVHNAAVSGRAERSPTD